MIPRISDMVLYISSYDVICIFVIYNIYIVLYSGMVSIVRKFSWYCMTSPVAEVSIQKTFQFQTQRWNPNRYDMESQATLCYPTKLKIQFDHSNGIYAGGVSHGNLDGSQDMLCLPDAANSEIRIWFRCKTGRLFFPEYIDITS